MNLVTSLLFAFVAKPNARVNYYFKNSVYQLGKKILETKSISYKQFSSLSNGEITPNFERNELRIANITSYQSVNKLLTSFSLGIDNIFGHSLIGIYLSGSLTYNDFNVSKSDIDISVILNHTMTVQELKLTKNFHQELERNNQIWVNRVECSYVPLDMLKSLSIPTIPRPYYNSGTFFAEANFGNEWIINNYLLYKHGIPLIGRDFKELIDQIEVIEVKKACVRDFCKEWIPKITDHVWLQNSYNQSYIILNLCRILYTVMQQPTGSKTVAASWVKNEFGYQWKNLIEEAEKWQSGKEIDLQEKVVLFIKFVAEKIAATKLYYEETADFIDNNTDKIINRDNNSETKQEEIQYLDSSYRVENLGQDTTDTSDL